LKALLEIADLRFRQAKVFRDLDFDSRFSHRIPPPSDV
jgi:hypothetical protein